MCQLSQTIKLALLLTFGLFSHFARGGPDVSVAKYLKRLDELDSGIYATTKDKELDPKEMLDLLEEKLDILGKLPEREAERRRPEETSLVNLGLLDESACAKSQSRKIDKLYAKQLKLDRPSINIIPYIDHYRDELSEVCDSNSAWEAHSNSNNDGNYDLEQDEREDDGEDSDSDEDDDDDDDDD